MAGTFLKREYGTEDSGFNQETSQGNKKLISLLLSVATMFAYFTVLDAKDIVLVDEDKDGTLGVWKEFRNDFDQGELVYVHFHAHITILLMVDHFISAALGLQLGFHGGRNPSDAAAKKLVKSARQYYNLGKNVEKEAEPKEDVVDAYVDLIGDTVQVTEQFSS